MDDEALLDSEIAAALDGVEEDLSIPFDTFFAILDEEPDPNSQDPSQVISEGLANGELAAGYTDPDGFDQEDGGANISNSPVLMENLTGEQQSFQWNAAAHIVVENSEIEKEPTVFNEYVENLSKPCFNNQILQIQSECNDTLGFTGYHMTSSLGCQRYPVQECRDESTSLIENHVSSMDCLFDHQMLPNCDVAASTAAHEGLFFSRNTFDSTREIDHEQIKGPDFFQNTAGQPEVNVPDISFFALESVRKDSSYVSGLADGSCNAARAAPESDFISREVFCSAPFMYSSMNYSVKLPNILAFKNAMELKHTLCSRKEELFHRKVEEEEELLAEQNSCSSSKVDLCMGEHSTEMWSPDLQMDFDEVLSKMPPEQNFHDELRFKSESSTDSSPLPSARNSTCESLDRMKKMALHSSLNQNNKKQKLLVNYERDVQVLASYNTQCNRSEISTSTVLNNPTRSSICMDDDADLCILDDISGPPHPPLRQHVDRHLVHRYGSHDHYQPGLGGPRRHKEDDENLTLRLALQDLTQPTSEASPPDGLLSVPLLRHQKIALSWMVQKETVSLAGRIYCSGGILADDQGLGKTISTIALILLERSPPSSSLSETVKQEKFEALNLDDDVEDDMSEHDERKQPRTSNPVVINGPGKKANPLTITKGRLSAGTLVVCPTSVLRQWADEIQNKVTPQANLSVLVYHGANRTKDPNEVAKYDVVLTTYSIVSMEIPKQPLGDDDEEKGRSDALGMESLINKKRKSSNSNRKGSKNGNALDSALLESAARPLARVNWFRVILDEAQSIKNHRTQVARSCWGLRAKRRWCLSGTPIQNAVEDLYSYFRFLRYGPYASYKTFCSLIKMPISRNPVNGYKKLQAVLKTIMLRRTKGSLIDGKPIITLPPKKVALKKVEFSREERDFYSSLEAESREQFKAYAALGTVKQNYVNILLMLLRLRQACDHPHLVKGNGSSSIWKSSLELARKLPRETQMSLLSCLEVRSAICSICNDPPEDAVVTTCGHVFCNQCICEHLTADDSICPSPDCKARLNISSIFSRGTLISSLSDLSGDDTHNSGESGSDILDQSKPYGSSLHSSKIKVALEILLSLPKVGPPSSEKFGDGTCRPIETSTETFSRRCSLNAHDKEKMLSSKSSKASVTEKAIVFSQWTRMLDLLEVPLKETGIQYRRLDGTMSVAARDKAVKDFNTVPEVTVMIMSLKAASLGLNMVAACHVVLLDLWWNPTTEDQAIDRAHRIGQTRPVTVFRLTVKDTVEDRILSLQEKKREMVASAFGEDESGTRQTRLTVDDLRYLFMA